MERSQPTAKAFPKGMRVKFLEDVWDTKYHLGAEPVIVASKGSEGVVLGSRDCDPFPSPYVYVDIKGGWVLCKEPYKQLGGLDESLPEEVVLSKDELDSKVSEYTKSWTGKNKDQYTEVLKALVPAVAGITGAEVTGPRTLEVKTPHFVFLIFTQDHEDFKYACSIQNDVLRNASSGYFPAIQEALDAAVCKYQNNCSRAIKGLHAEKENLTLMVRPRHG